MPAPRDTTREAKPGEPPACPLAQDRCARHRAQDRRWPAPAVGLQRQARLPVQAHRMARQSLACVSIIWPLGARESRRRGTGNRTEGSLAYGATVPTERPALRRIVSEELIRVRPSTTRSRQLNLRICRPPHRLMNLLDWVIENLLEPALQSLPPPTPTPTAADTMRS